MQDWRMILAIWHLLFVTGRFTAELRVAKFTQLCANQPTPVV
jgi:hypothetical protein